MKTVTVNDMVQQIKKMHYYAIRLELDYEKYEPKYSEKCNWILNNYMFLPESVLRNELDKWKITYKESVTAHDELKKWYKDLKTKKGNCLIKKDIILGKCVDTDDRLYGERDFIFLLVGLTPLRN